jgi:LMBR1 domain-containing protein 1
MREKIIRTTMMVKGNVEADESKSSANQIGYAIKWTIPTLIFMGGVIAAMYYGGLGYAEISTTVLQSPLFETSNLESISANLFFNMTFYCNATGMGVPILLPLTRPLGVNETAPTYTPKYYGTTGLPQYDCSGLNALCCRTPIINSVVVSPGVFIIAVVTLVGWLIFSIFCGVGMAALPYDLLNEFKHRSRPISRQTYS